jgi:TonB family protein
MLRADDVPETPDSKTFLNGNPGQERSYPLADLVHTLAQHGAESIAADLALDIVLNDIVKQACVATGASGAAIALIRDEEMVCRASSGPDAPSLGVRLDIRLGLSGECAKSREVQLCADAETDPRVDAEACRRAGIRSILVSPLLDGPELFGVFVIVSRQPNAFGRLDTITLLGLAHQVVENHRAAHETTGQLQAGERQLSTWRADTVIDPEPVPVAEAEPEPAEAPTQVRQIDNHGGGGSKGQRLWRIDFWTAFFSVLVFGAAMFMSGLAGWRLGVQSVPMSPANRTSRPTNAASQETNSSRALSTASPQTSSSRGTPKSDSVSASKPVTSRSKPSAGLAAGGLVVYEKGRVVYQVAPSPSTAAADRKTQTNQKAVVLAAGISPEMRQVPPEVAQALLLDRVEPQYPAEARQQRVQGAVVLQAEISREGRVQKLKVISGDSALTESAMQAVRRWRYRPYSAEGRPIAMQTTITVNFTPPAE